MGRHFLSHAWKLACRTYDKRIPTYLDERANIHGSQMDCTALGERVAWAWVNGRPGIVLVMDFDVLDCRAAGYRPLLWTPIPWMNGVTGVVILADSHALDKRWPGIVLRYGLRFPGWTGYRADGYRDPRGLRYTR